jgi:hypothetical protein
VPTNPRLYSTRRTCTRQFSDTNMRNVSRPDEPKTCYRLQLPLNKWELSVMYSTGQNSFGVILYYKPWAHPPTNHYLVCLDKCGDFFLENKARKPSPCPSSTSAQSSPSDEHGILSPRQSQAPMAGWQPPMAPNHVCLELTTAISGQTHLLWPDQRAPIAAAKAQKHAGTHRTGTTKRQSRP